MGSRNLRKQLKKWIIWYFWAVLAYKYWTIWNTWLYFCWNYWVSWVLCFNISCCRCLKLLTTNLSRWSWSVIIWYNQRVLKFCKCREIESSCPSNWCKWKGNWRDRGWDLWIKFSKHSRVRRFLINILRNIFANLTKISRIIRSLAVNWLWST
jgi:hypothetical protein